MKLIDWNIKDHSVSHDAMDKTHEEFVELVNAAVVADSADFLAAYDAVVTHTEAHFATEDDLMKASGFGAIKEHQAEHARILRDFQAFRRFAAKGMANPARAFIKGAIPDWFSLHLMTMDMALASHVKQSKKSKKAA